MSDTQPLPPDGERWAVIPFCSGYEASSLGRVRSVDRVIMRSNGQPQRRRGQILSLIVRSDGRPTVCVSRGKHRTKRFVHHLVLEAFVGPRPEGMECCHDDDDPANNRLENLRWDTHSSNLNDRIKNGSLWQANRTHCPLTHLLADPNLVPSSLPRRGCLACNRARRNVSWWRTVKGVDLDLQQVADAYYAEIMMEAAA